MVILSLCNQRSCSARAERSSPIDQDLAERTT
jgi:hypothetical protein